MSRVRGRRVVRMLEVVVGVALTAFLGGLLVPIVKDRLDRRSEQFRSSLALVDTLASSLWAYWKLALRVAYHGRQAQQRVVDYLDREIDSLLTYVMADLKLGGTPRRLGTGPARAPDRP